jgi:hypothetical protein
MASSGRGMRGWDGTVRTFYQCQSCGAWAPREWSDKADVCTRCFLTTMHLLEGFDLAMMSPLRRWWEQWLLR